MPPLLTITQPSSPIVWAQETGLLWIGAVLAVLLVLHVVATWAEKRGWIYYRHGGRGGGVSNALSQFEAVLNPAAEHRIEEERSERVLRAGASQGQSEGDELVIEAGEVVWRMDTDPDSE